MRFDLSLSDELEALGAVAGGFKRGASSSQANAHLNNLSSLIAQFQHDFVDFSLVAADKHRQLRKQFESHAGASEELASLKRMRQLAEDLFNHIGRGFEGAAEFISTRLEHYFEIDGRCKFGPPRICVKAFDEHQRTISDLYRYKSRNINTPFAYQLNTGFVSVIEKGCPFLCNDIPTEWKKNRYKNKRLKEDRKSRFKHKLKHRVGYHLLRNPDDREWEDCWEPTQGDHLDIASCYKSTMILPITLNYYDVSGGLVDILRVDQGSYEGLNYGFLCLDHRHANYFNGKEDTGVIGLFASLLSLYGVIAQNYCRSSDTIDGILSLFADAGVFADSPLFHQAHSLILNEGEITDE